jgi:predicted small lipoprotein YifL
MKKIIICTLSLGLLLLTACGQKGPLVLDKLPTEQTQVPLENTNDVVPVELEPSKPE